MAAAHPSLTGVQAQFDALIKLVDHQAEPLQQLQPTREEQFQIKAVLQAWSKTMCCLNLSAACVYLGPVLQFLQQRFNALRTAIDNKQALRFDVLVLGIVSRSICADGISAKLNLPCPGTARLVNTG